MTVDYLLKLLELLKIEKEEDFRLYQQQFLSCSIIERKQNGLTWYPVVIKNAGFGFGDNLVLELERTNDMNIPHQFQNGKNAEFFGIDSSENSIKGTIKSIEGNKLLLALNTDDLPDWASDGKLGVNMLFDDLSYREMEITLNKVIKADGNRLAELREILLGRKVADFNKVDAYQNDKLNESQIKGIEKILSAKDVAVIHGPPGTGKTTTLVEGIIATLQSENHVLVCSPSNIGIDVICEKLISRNVNVLRLGNPVRVSESLLQNTLEGKITSSKYYNELRESRKRAEEFRAMAQKYKRSFGRNEREQRNLLFSEARQSLKEASKLEDYILKEAMEKAQVIACTLVGSSGRLLKDRFFSTLFIDEAGQALEPASWIPITKAARVVFAGDHLQLPPTVKSKQAAEAGLSQTLFEKCMAKENLSVMLDTQYRMNNEIMNFSNGKFYNNKLKAHDSVALRKLDLKETPEFNSPFEFIDTAGCGFEEELNSSTQSLWNEGEANILFKRLSALLYAYKAENKTDFMSIGIISPYKSQTEFIKENLEQYEILQEFKSRISIKSIDGFQGQEKDVIFISLVRSNENGEIGFLNDVRRMNVALTRAKKKLVVIGDSATLSFHPFYKNFLDYVESINGYKSAWEFLD